MSFVGEYIKSAKHSHTALLSTRDLDILGLVIMKGYVFI